MDALLFTMALEMALIQMRIVDGCAALQSLHCRPQDSSASVASQWRLERAKLLDDRQLVRSVVRATLVGMSDEGAWPSLRNAVLALAQRSAEVAALRQSHDGLLSDRASVSKVLKTKKAQHRREMCLADNTITFLNDKKADDITNAEIRLLYVDKWMNARSQALELQSTTTRAVLPSAEHETRVHSELVAAFELQIQEREKSLEHWRLKYADDSASINQSLAENREMLRVTRAKREQLQTLYNLHEGEMRSWLNFKRERAARLAREERAHKSATLIQAWWRGEMVRKALGAFKHLRSAKKSPSKTKKK